MEYGMLPKDVKILDETSTIGYKTSVAVVNGKCVWCKKNAASLNLQHFKNHVKNKDKAKL